MWKRLLVPHDFSPCAARALDVAAALADRSHGVVTIAHVAPLPPNSPRFTPLAPRATATAPIEDVLTAGARRELAAIAAPLIARGLAVQTVARAADQGSIAEEILRVAAELGADVVVLGTRGRTGIARLFLGSVADEVVRSASVPVVTIRSTDDASHPTREEERVEDELAG